jgi:hypothetical protein
MWVSLNKGPWNLSHWRNTIRIYIGTYIHTYRKLNLSLSEKRWTFLLFVSECQKCRKTLVNIFAMIQPRKNTHPLFLLCRHLIAVNFREKKPREVYAGHSKLLGWLNLHCWDDWTNLNMDGRILVKITQKILNSIVRR